MFLCAAVPRFRFCVKVYDRMPPVRRLRELPLQWRKPHTRIQGRTASGDSSGGENISRPRLRSGEPSEFRSNARVCKFHSADHSVNAGCVEGFCMFLHWVQEGAAASTVPTTPLRVCCRVVFALSDLDSTSRTNSWAKRTSFEQCMKLCQDAQTEFALLRESLGVSRVNHILRVHGHSPSGTAGCRYDEVGQRSLERLIPHLTEDSMTQATLRRETSLLLHWDTS